MKILENDIREQECNLEHRKSKLWKTQFTTGVLFIVTLLHIANYRETHDELSVIIKDQASLTNQLIKQKEFQKIAPHMQALRVELRVQGVMEELNKAFKEEESRLF